MRTSRDGDLRGWTRADVLPADGMQEVRGSNPLSSTGQRRNSKTRPLGTAAKYSNPVARRTPQPAGIKLRSRKGLLASHAEAGSCDGVLERPDQEDAPFAVLLILALLLVYGVLSR